MFEGTWEHWVTWGREETKDAVGENPTWCLTLVMSQMEIRDSQPDGAEGKNEFNNHL